MTSCTGSVHRGFGVFEKSQGVEFLPPKKKVDFRSSPRPCGGCRTWWGSRWKSQHRKIVYLSPYVEKPFDSKVIKSFVPELRSRKCFCVSGFLCVLCNSMSISHIHVWVRYLYIIWCRRPKHVVHRMITNMAQVNQRDDQET